MGRPTGTLKPFFLPSVLEDSSNLKLAAELFNKVDTFVEVAERHYKTISFVDQQKSHGAVIPSIGGPERTGIRRYIEDFTVGAANQNDSSISITLTIDVLEILESSYTFFGMTDYYILFKEISTEQCAELPNHDCLTVVVQYWPSKLRTATFHGTRDEVAGDIAVLILRGALRTRDSIWRNSAQSDDTPPFLLEPDTPETMSALRSAANGISILMAGSIHQACIDRARSYCLELATDELRKSTNITKPNESTYNPVAAYGLALLQIANAVQSASQGDSALTVVYHLRKAELWTQRALTSDFLEEKMKHMEFSTLFSNSVELAGLRPSEEFLHLVPHFSCALLEHWRANWSTCIDMLNNLGKMPELLDVYLEAARWESELNLGTKTLQNSGVHDYLENSGNSINSPIPFQIHLVSIKEACHRTGQVSDGEFSKRVDALLDNVPQGNAIATTEAVIRSSGCRSDQEMPTVNLLSDAISHVHELASVNSLEHGRLMLVLSEYYARIDSLDMALETLIEALHLPWTRDFLMNSPVLANITEDAAHKQKLIDGVSSTKTEFSDLVTCPNLNGDEA